MRRSHIKKLAAVSVLALLVKGICSADDAPAFWKLLEAGRLNEAEKAALMMHPPEKHVALSRVYFYRGEYASAADEIGRSQSTGPERENLSRYYAALADIQKDSREFESEHFRMRVRGADVILPPYGLDALEKAYREIGGDLGCFPQDKVLVEIYPSKSEFSLASTLGEDVLEKSGTVGICKFNRIMMLSPQALPLGFHWLDTLAHEYTHFLVNRKSAARCPLWLHEGIARYSDTRWRLRDPLYLSPDAENRLSLCRKNNGFIPFERMYPSLVYLKDQDEIALAFAEVSLAVHFMKERFGAGSVGKLLDGLAAGNDEKDAFKGSLGTTPRKFEKLWLEYARTVPLRESPGAVNDQVQFEQKKEEDFIGADQRGQVRLGDEMRKIGRGEAALVHYGKALAQEPANPVILLKAARTLLSLGRAKEAEERLSEAIRKNPKYVTPYQVLGELYAQEQRYGDAVGTLTEAIAMNPFHPKTHYYLSRCYCALGDREQALRELAATALLDPGDAETNVLLERLK